ncbi:ornithine carbamoyltransferase [Yunchengibacter salinarum]|uniref:ornithine carbamoyltransferase n=1 Tax=Yunchengibacter salinarum TaxID=3133399 RepID=UPI0035B5D165
MSTPGSCNHFIDLADCDAATLTRLLDEAARRKVARAGQPKGVADADRPLAGHMLAMVFEKASTRTRISFDMAMRQLGGETMVLQGDTMQLGRGESVADTARVMGRYVDGLMIRARSHGHVREMADNAGVPVINALTDRSHPCQIMADLLTLREHFGPDLSALTLAWVGDGNNMANTFIEAAAILGFTLRVCTPAGYEVDGDVMRWAAGRMAEIEIVRDPREAVAGAHGVITDTWVSMGDDRTGDRLAAFSAFRVDEDLMAAAGEDAVFLHCLPAHRGEEVTDAVMDGPRALVWDEAENRLHAQKAVLLHVFGCL